MPPIGILVVADAFRTVPARPPRPAAGIAALEQVANRPIVHHVVDALWAAGVREVIVVSSPESRAEVADCLAGYDRTAPKLTYAPADAPVHLVSALRSAVPLVGSAPCIAHLANGLLGEPIRAVDRRLLKAAPDIVLLVHQGAEKSQHLSKATQQLLNIAELDPGRSALGMAGVCLFGEGALARVADAAWSEGGEVDLTMVAERVEAAQGQMHIGYVDSWHRYEGDPLDLLELNRMTLDALPPDLPQAHRSGNRIEGRVLIHDTASVNVSVIIGPTVIGAGAHISDAYIGPYTSVGSGVRIEGAEIERSIISPGASVMHVGGRLVTSVVGRDARVFRDFSLPRAMRLRVGAGGEIALC